MKSQVNRASGRKGQTKNIPHSTEKLSHQKSWKTDRFACCNNAIQDCQNDINICIDTYQSNNQRSGSLQMSLQFIILLCKSWWNKTMDSRFAELQSQGVGRQWEHVSSLLALLYSLWANGKTNHRKKSQPHKTAQTEWLLHRIQKSSRGFLLAQIWALPSHTLYIQFRDLRYCS